MPPAYRWQHPRSIETLQQIVKKAVPQWTDGLRPAQLEIVPVILDREDALCIDVTGGGKSAAYSVPILVHNEVSSNPTLYPGFSCQAHAVGIVVTPTKGLANNIVEELEGLGISALAYTAKRKAQAHRNNEKLADEITSCTRWQVICVDPEHLREDDWRCTIARSPTFCNHLIYACAEEGHLMAEWGLDFRKAFQFIGVYIRGCLPSSISVFSLSATLAPGKDTISACKSLGFTRGSYKLIRHSNERVNTQVIFAPLTNGIAGTLFPQIFDYLVAGRKAIIHCASKDLVLRVFIYLWKHEPPGTNHLRRVRMYHSTCADDYNQETLRLLDTDPYCQVVVSTVAFANGINVRTLLDSISIGYPDTTNQMVQQKGRVGRIREMASRGIVLIQPRQITQAKEQLSLTDQETQRKPKKSPPKPIESAKARLITETVCLVAALNKEYGNPPVETARLDCIQAERRLLCSLCAQRCNQVQPITVPTYSPDAVLPPPFLPPAPKSKAKSAEKISKEDRIVITSKLQDLATRIWHENHTKEQFRNLPRSAYFPPSISKLVFSRIRSLGSYTDLLSLVGPLSWRFTFEYGSDLYDLIAEIQVLLFPARRKANGKRRRVDSDDSQEEFSTIESEPEEEQDVDAMDTVPSSSPRRPPSKRQTLADMTNLPKAAPRKAASQRSRPESQKSTAEVAASYGPVRKSYRTENSRARNRNAT